MHYVILETAGAIDGERVELSTLRRTVETLAGRSCPFLDRELHRVGRCYVATAPDSPGRERYGRGFVVAARSE